MNELAYFRDPEREGFHPERPGGRADLTGSRRVTKSEASALLFHSLFNRVTADQDRIDETLLTHSRAIAELVRRVDVLEQTLKLHREILGAGEPMVRFSCIACDNEFELPHNEAERLDFTALCGRCHSWACAYPERLTYSPSAIAGMAGVSYETVLRVIDKHGLNPEPGRKMTFDQDQAREILAILKARAIDRDQRRAEGRACERLLAVLGDEVMTAHEIAAALGRGLSTVRGLLRVLQKAGIVESPARGQFRAALDEEEILVPLSAERQARIEKMAKRNNRSVNTEIIVLLREELARREKKRLLNSPESATL